MRILGDATLHEDVDNSSFSNLRVVTMTSYGVQVEENAVTVLKFLDKHNVGKSLYELVANESVNETIDISTCQSSAVSGYQRSNDVRRALSEEAQTTAPW